MYIVYLASGTHTYAYKYNYRCVLTYLSVKPWLYIIQVYRSVSMYWDRDIPVKSTDFGGSLPIFLPPYRQPTDLPQSTDSTDFFADLPNFNFF